MKLLKLANSSKYAILDDEDYQRVAESNWFLSEGNIIASIDDKSISLGRFILGNSNLPEVDHKNRNILDNQKKNLRNCTRAQNCQNRAIPFNNLSGYKGVSFNNNSKKWVVQISVNGARFHLGYFKTKEEAALAYNKAALKYHGEFASLNDIK